MGSLTNSEIPIVDCAIISDGEYSLSLKDSPEFKEFATSLGNGFCQMGLVYFINHGIEESIITDCFTASKAFFELPASLKAPYTRLDQAHLRHGYAPPRGDFKEQLALAGNKMYLQSAYPSETPQLFPAMTTFIGKATTLSKKILLALGLHFGLDDAEYLIKLHSDCFDDTGSRDSWADMKTRFYHAMTDDDLATIGPDHLRLPEHPDGDTLTFLVQDEAGGLEARNGAGVYIPVPHVPGALVVNAGLSLELWTGGRIPGVLHRVQLIKEKAKEIRQSLGYFLTANGDAECDILVEQKPGWKWSDRLPVPGKKLEGFYLKEIQIIKERHYDKNDGSRSAMRYNRI